MSGLKNYNFGSSFIFYDFLSNPKFTAKVTLTEFNRLFDKSKILKNRRLYRLNLY